MTNIVKFTLFSIVMDTIMLILGLYLGREVERARIAGAIRSGRLSVIQRVESIAQEIETGKYSQ